MSLKNYKELDGIRAIAAILVMFLHFFELTPDMGNKIVNTLKHLAAFGQTGVTLFFVLSGFLITRILLSTKKNTNYFKNFYIRRSLRIFPLYYMYLIIVFIIVPFFTHSLVPPKDSWYYWIYLQNFAITFNWPHSEPTHFWSLAVEEHFYLFWPVLIYYLNVKRIIQAIAIIIIFSLICRILLLNHGYEVFYFTFTNMDALAIGSVLAILEIRNKLNNRNAGFYFFMFLALFIPAVFLGIFISGQKLYIAQLLKLPVIAVSYFFLIIYVIKCSKNNILKRILSARPLAYLGKISYGLYVFHPICFVICMGLFKSGNIVLNFIFEFGSAIIIASISFYGYESFFLRFKNYFQYSDTKVQTRDPANYTI